MKELINGINWRLVLAAVAVAALISWLFIFDGFGKLKGLKGLLNININNSSNNSSNNDNRSAATSTSTSTSRATAYGQQGFPLHQGTGSKHNPSAEVSDMQELANYYLRVDIDTDGVWGPDTEKAMNRLRGTTRYDPNGTIQPQDYQFATLIANGGELQISESAYDTMKRILMADQACHTNQNIA